MKLSASDAALLSERERAMLRSTGPWYVADLVSLIKRLRDLRDKQRQINQRSVVASARSAKGKAAAVNARTVKKALILDKALKHFEGELEAINRQSTAAAAALKAAGKPAKKAPAKKAVVKKAESKPTAARKPAPAGKPKTIAASKKRTRKDPNRRISAKERKALATGGDGATPAVSAGRKPRGK